MQLNTKGAMKQDKGDTVDIGCFIFSSFSN